MPSGRYSLNDEIRYQVVHDKKNKKFLVWDTKTGKSVLDCLSRTEAEECKKRFNKK